MPTAFQNRALQGAQLSLVGVFFFIPIWLAATNTLMAIMLICWLLAGEFKLRWESVKNNPITLPALLLYGLVIVGMSYGPASPTEMLQHLNKYSKFLFILIAISLLQEAAWRQRCWQAFTFAMVFTLASVYANIWFDLPWSVTHNKGWDIDHTVFKDYIAQSIMMALFVLLCIHQCLQTPQRKIQALWAALGTLAFVSVTHLSNGRTGYLSLLLSLAVYGLTIIHRPKKWLWVSAASLIFALLISTSTTLSHRFHSVISDIQSYTQKSTGGATNYQMTPSGARLAMWKLSISQMAKQPLIGAGTGSYHSIAKQEFTDPELCSKNCIHPHNQFLFFGVEYGLLGILAYLFYFYRPYKFAQTLSPPHKSLLLGFLSILFVDSMTHGALWLSVESHFFTFIMALLMSLHSKPEMKKEP